MKDIIQFYREERRYLFIIIVFILLFFIFLFVDMSIYPYPPMLAFADPSGAPIDGTVELNLRTLGTTSNGMFYDLPKEFCAQDNKISLVTAQESYIWDINRQKSCLSNVIQIKVD